MLKEPDECFRPKLTIEGASDVRQVLRPNERLAGRLHRRQPLHQPGGKPDVADTRPPLRLPHRTVWKILVANHLSARIRFYITPQQVCELANATTGLQADEQEYLHDGPICKMNEYLAERLGLNRLPLLGDFVQFLNVAERVVLDVRTLP
jgi:hypothetical protein